MPETIPLVSFEGDQFLTGQKALQILDTLEPPIAAVAVAGLYRTGKSFLLNRVILRQNEAFTVGSTINACTKGIWMWSEPIVVQDDRGRDVNVIVIDTEGIGATTADASHDTRVFSLGLLLSSFFVYNSVGSIDEQALSNLSLVTNISKEIRVSAQDALDDEHPEDFQEFFPAFLWVVRDFALQLRDTNGNEIGPDQYLENSLQMAKGKNAASKNKIRDTLRAFFPERNCVTLVRPCSDERDLQRLDTLPDRELRPEFLDEAYRLRQLVMNQTANRPLTMHGQELSGSMLGLLCQSYTDSINEGGAPVIQDAWTYMCDAQKLKAEQQAVSKFSVEMERLSGATPETFYRESNMLLLQALTDYRTLCSKLEQEPGDLEGQLRPLLNQGMEQNARHYESIIQGLCIEYQDKLRDTNAVTIQEFKQHFLDLHAEFGHRMDNAVDTPWGAWYARVLPQVWDTVSRLNGENEGRIERMARELADTKAELREGRDHYDAKMDELRSKHMVELADKERELGASNERLQEELTQATQKLTKSQLTLEDIQREMGDEISELGSKVAAVEAQLLEEQGKVETAEARANHFEAEVEELSALSETLENFQLELSTCTVERDHLQKQLNEARWELESAKKELADVEKSSREQRRLLEESSMQAVEQIKKVRKTEQAKLRSELEETRQQLDQARAQLQSVQREIEVMSDQKRKSVAAYEQQVEEMKSQMVDCQLRLESKQQEYDSTVKEITERNRTRLQELEDKEAEHRERQRVQEREWSQRQQELESRATGAESKLLSQKRQLEQAEDLLRRKRQRADDTQQSLVLAKAQVELDWLKQQKAEQDSTVTNLQGRVRELEAQLREYERTNDSQLVRLRLEYEGKIAQLEEQLAQ